MPCPPYKPKAVYTWLPLLPSYSLPGLLLIRHPVLFPWYCQDHFNHSIFILTWILYLKWSLPKVSCSWLVSIVQVWTLISPPKRILSDPRRWNNISAHMHTLCSLLSSITFSILLIMLYFILSKINILSNHTRREASFDIRVTSISFSALSPGPKIIM